ncbi:hypothetical protein [Nocardia sp. NPDC127526]|uniref:hypothetical protein n=1 Tax=Nocardia sp. NPDC127526 TaxID=3345393 RepID=UPI003632B6B7
MSDPARHAADAADAAATRMHELLDARARLAAELLATEQQFISNVALVHELGGLDYRGLISAYEQVREWGLTGYSRRWLEWIEHDLNNLRRFANATPTTADGTWSGNTGFEGLDDSVHPARGMHTAFVLFGEGGTPIHIGFTQQFRSNLSRLHHQAGLRWASWKAWPCASRHDAIERRKQLGTQFHVPNVAESGSDTVPRTPGPHGTTEGPKPWT